MCCYFCFKLSVCGALPDGKISCINAARKQALPHPPPRGGWPTADLKNSEVILFNPRPPRGGRQCFLSFCTNPIVISIRALRVEGDHCVRAFRRCAAKFQSAPSVWRATLSGEARPCAAVFQSAPSVWRATLRALGGCRWNVEFQSAPSTRRAPNGIAWRDIDNGISIRALRVEGDCDGE